MFGGAEVVRTADGGYDRNPEMCVEEAQVSGPATIPKLAYSILFLIFFNCNRKCLI